MKPSKSKVVGGKNQACSYTINESGSRRKKKFSTCSIEMLGCSSCFSNRENELPELQPEPEPTASTSGNTSSGSNTSNTFARSLKNFEELLLETVQQEPIATGKRKKIASGCGVLTRGKVVSALEEKEKAKKAKRKRGNDEVELEPSENEDSPSQVGSFVSASSESESFSESEEEFSVDLSMEIHYFCVVKFKIVSNKNQIKHFIDEIFEINGQRYFIKFLRKHGNKFILPDIKDEVWVKKSEIVTKIKRICTDTTSRQACVYQFDPNILNLFENVY
ncbi:hypothetical protein PGB90_006556 [Kerria lacca]